ncbi:MAG: peptidoglycan DD-metalloendopeptidase family protein [Cytophagales bacterium]
MYPIGSTNRHFLIFLFLSISFVSVSQKRTELESKKKNTIAIIEETRKIIEETKVKKKTTIGQLNAINKQILAKKALIEAQEQELLLLEEEINELSYVISSLENDLEDLKKEYAAMIYASAKSTGKLDKTLYLLASESFTQLSMRLKYLQFYSDSRKDQIKQIDLTKSHLFDQKQTIEGKKLKKELLLNELLEEKKQLDELKNEQNSIAKELNAQEKSLKAKLEEHKKSIKKLDMLIADIVKKEIEESRRKALEQKKKEQVAKNVVSLTPETKIIADNFEANKKKLMWPVRYGFVSQPFGIAPHPVLKHVTIDNLGVDIQTNKNEKIRAVFKGKVTAVATVPGMNQVVMVQHGDYFTVYAKLKTSVVKIGDFVEAGDNLGEVYTDSDDVSVLQFQIWKNNDRLNPEDWLIPKK